MTHSQHTPAGDPARKFTRVQTCRCCSHLEGRETPRLTFDLDMSIVDAA